MECPIFLFILVNILTELFIMGGDFNRDIITNYIITDKYKLFKLKNINNNLKTCCGINKYKFKYNYDHVISTIKPIKKIIFNEYIPSSDHILVIVELKDI